MTASAEEAALTKPGILVTGGAGYIGSITTVALIERGSRPVVLDNVVNSQPAVVKRIEQLTGTPVALARAGVRDAAALNSVFAQHRIDAVVHFAGLKAVGESVARPLDYHDVNVGGTVTLLRALAQVAVGRQRALRAQRSLPEMCEDTWRWQSRHPEGYPST